MLLALATPYADACTRIFSNTTPGSFIVARSMDWATTTEPILTVFPRGVEHDGGKVGTMEAVPVNPLHWTSTYGSVVTTIYGIGTADGINEAGLQGALWAQYALDSSATVAQALEKLQAIQVVKISIVKHGTTQNATVHLALEDATGDSAILEYIG
jgi:choloylglycine hydrolase